MPDPAAGRLRLRSVIPGVGATGLAIAAVLSPADARAAAGQTWPPFVLVAGLLMVGVVANADNVFSALGGRAARLRVGPAALLAALLAVVAGVTALLNLDTSVAFLTPVVVLAARGRGLDEEPFLFGTLFMSNAASLLLPGSNLTNLLVLGREHVAGAVFAARVLPAWLASVVVTAVFTVVVYRGRLRRGDADPEPVPDTAGGRYRPSWSIAGIGAVAVLLVALPSPALPVLLVGSALAARARARGALSTTEVVDAVDPAVLAGVFAIAVALGVLARSWSGPSHLVATAGGMETAVVGAIASVLLNNLPAAVLLTSRPLAHPTALLLGLNIGPNLAVTGSLSALIWFRAARSVGAAPSAARVTRLGVVLVPLTLLAGGLALWAFPVGVG